MMEPREYTIYYKTNTIGDWSQTVLIHNLAEYDALLEETKKYLAYRGGGLADIYDRSTHWFTDSIKVY